MTCLNPIIVLENVQKFMVFPKAVMCPSPKRDKVFSKVSKWSPKKLEIFFSQNLATTSVHYFHKNPSHGSSHWNCFLPSGQKFGLQKKKNKQNKLLLPLISNME
jgi:hypothetical protein